MPIKTFTSEQIDKLRENPAVASVNEYFLSFTPDFKEWVCQELQSGKSIKWILYEAGFDLDTIPKSRYRSIRTHILQWKLRQKTNAKKVDSKTVVSARELTVAKNKIAKLEKELKRTSQELEFVKKIIYAGQED